MPEDNRFQPLSTVSLSGDDLSDPEVSQRDDTSPQASQIGSPTNEPPWSEDFQVDCPHCQFVKEDMGASLPQDSQKQGAFDNRSHGVIGDPGAQFGGVRQLDYETSGLTGAHFEHVRWVNTGYVSVDNRDPLSLPLHKTRCPTDPLSRHGGEIGLRCMVQQRNCVFFFSSPLVKHQD